MTKKDFFEVVKPRQVCSVVFFLIWFGAFSQQTQSKEGIALSGQVQNQADDDIYNPSWGTEGFTMPEYPGGIMEFRKGVMKYFDTSAFKDRSGNFKSVVIFTIDKEGKISDIIVKGEDDKFNKACEVMITKMSNKKRWKPATFNGNPTRYKFTLPVTMNFG